MEVNLVIEGLKFMVLGMVTVFLFLILLIIILRYQAKFINRFFPQKTTTSPQILSKTDDTVLVAAITAAIIEFKKSKN